jgi:hypothetical protein
MGLRWHDISSTAFHPPPNPPFGAETITGTGIPDYLEGVIPICLNHGYC